MSAERGRELQPLMLSQEEFLRSFEYTPRVALNVLLIDSQGRVLLAKRSIPPDEGLWHMPGGFVLKNESKEAALHRILKKEIGLDELPSEPELAGYFDDLDKDPRGHVIDIAFVFQIGDEFVPEGTAENVELRFFKKLPPNMGFNHRDTLHRLGFEDEQEPPAVA